MHFVIEVNVFIFFPGKVSPLPPKAVNFITALEGWNLNHSTR